MRKHFKCSVVEALGLQDVQHDTSQRASLARTNDHQPFRQGEIRFPDALQLSSQFSQSSVKHALSLQHNGRNHTPTLHTGIEFTNPVALHSIQLINGVLLAVPRVNVLDDDRQQQGNGPDIAFFVTV